MVARRYEIPLRVDEKFLHLQAVMKCSVYYISTNEIPNHFTLILFVVIFSLAKMTFYFYA